MSAASFLQIETDESSSLCDVPKLPTGTPKVRWLGDETGTEEAGDTSSQASAPQLYAYLPIGNVADTVGEGSSTDSMRPSTSAAQDPKIRELSGRSRAILKQYFDDDASTITFPLGHRTVAFTEPQIYHLLRVLTDETLKMSYSTMEQMVIGAVRGAPSLPVPELTTSRSDQGLKLPAQGCKMIRKIVRGLNTVLDQGLTPLKDPALAKKVEG